MGIQPTAFKAEMAQVDSDNIIRKCNTEIYKFDSCEDDGICDTTKTDMLICDDEVESNYFSLNVGLDKAPHPYYVQ